MRKIVTMTKTIARKSSLAFTLALVLIFIGLAGPELTSENIVLAQTPQTYTVDTFNDTDDANKGDQQCLDSQGNCSLRAAISEVNFGNGGDTINIAQAGTYALSLGGTEGDFNNTGDLDIAKSLTINNTSGGQVIVTADDNFEQVFDVGPAPSGDITVAFNGFTVTGATGNDQAIFVRKTTPFEATLNLTNMTVTANAHRGLLNEHTGTVNISNSFITDNLNGGIMNFGDMTITGTEISGNTGSPGLWNTYVTHNNVTYYGVMNVNNSVITLNETSGNGGGVITERSAETTIASSYITRNRAVVGAGVYVEKNITIRKSVIAGNVAVGDTSVGGGIFLKDADASSSATITDTTISDNVAQGFTNLRERGGGGIFNDNGNMSLENVTITGNQADSGGGFYFRGRDNHSYDVMNLNNVTITDNRAEYGGGYYMREDAYGQLYVKNTILSGNTAEIRAPNCYDLYQRTTSQGFNLIGNNVECLAYDGAGDDIVGQSASLETLQDNGGPTCTHALQSTSLARDAGNTCTATDQRGATRDGSCDIGAFEYNASAIANNPALECDFGNDAPTANDDSYTTPFQTPLIIAAPGVLENDSDNEGDPLTAQVDVASVNGNIAMLPDGSFVYTPDNGFAGEDSFTYMAEDEFSQSNVATVRITVTSPLPIARDDTYTTLPGQQLLIPANQGVLLNDIDPFDGSPLSTTDTTQPAGGQVVMNSDGSFTYTPNPGFNGIDTFTYKATDGPGKSDPATVTIVVSQTRPTSQADSYATAKNTPISVSIENGVLANDTDPNGDGLVAIVDIAPPASEGTLILNPNGSFTFTPELTFVGTSTFTYHASDGSEDSNISTVSIVVSSSVPVAVDDEYTTPVNVPLTVPAPGFLGNDIDPNSLTLTASIQSTTTNGTLTPSGDGGFSYTPNTGFTGADTFTYTASNGTDVTNLATVKIVVADGTSSGPIAVNDTYQTGIDQTLIVDANTGILANDTGTNLTPSLVQNVSFGTLSLSNDGSFSYQPNSGYVGFDQFTYQVNDGNNNSNIATVTIAVGDVPTATNDAYTVQTEQILNVLAATGVLFNDNDPANGTMTATLVQNVTNGTLTLNLDGSFTYQSNPGFVGNDSFTYTANNGQANSNIATVTITVTGAPGGTLAFLSPVNGSTITDLPTYSWAHVSTAISYDLGVIATDGTLMGYVEGLLVGDYCVGDICSINLALETNQGWLWDGAYTAFVAISGTSDWKVTNFLLDATPPTVPTNLNMTEPNSSRPTVNWMLDVNSARAYWFNLVVVTNDANNTLMVNTWVSRADACGDTLTCSIPLPQDILYNYSYGLYMSSWGPGGLSTGGLGGAAEGWIGPANFTINAPAPGTIQGLSSSANGSTGKSVFAWNHQPGVTWYQFWVGTVFGTNITTYDTGWLLSFDLNCEDDDICEYEVDNTLLPGGNSYKWYVQGWSPGGLTIGTVSGTGFSEGDFTP